MSHAAHNVVCHVLRCMPRLSHQRHTSPHEAEVSRAYIRNQPKRAASLVGTERRCRANTRRSSRRAACPCLQSSASWQSASLARLFPPQSCVTTVRSSRHAYPSAQQCTGTGRPTASSSASCSLHWGSRPAVRRCRESQRIRRSSCIVQSDAPECYCATVQRPVVQITLQTASLHTYARTMHGSRRVW